MAAPTAAILSPRIRTDPLSIGGPESVYTLAPRIRNVGGASAELVRAPNTQIKKEAARTANTKEREPLWSLVSLILILNPTQIANQSEAEATLAAELRVTQLLYLM
jgi:hypothetical protein